MPYVFVVLRPRLWPGCPSVLVGAALAVLGSSPMGVVANLLGVARFGQLRSMRLADGRVRGARRIGGGGVGDLAAASGLSGRV